MASIEATSPRHSSSRCHLDDTPDTYHTTHISKDNLEPVIETLHTLCWRIRVVGQIHRQELDNDLLPRVADRPARVDIREGPPAVDRDLDGWRSGAEHQQKWGVPREMRDVQWSGSWLGAIVRSLYTLEMLNGDYSRAGESRGGWEEGDS